MGLPVLQFSVLLNNALAPGATVTVRHESDNSLATLFTARDGSAETSSPGVVTANFKGFVQVFTFPGIYDVTASSGGLTDNHDYVVVPDQLELITDATTARTLQALDAGNYLRFTNGSAINLTVPADAVLDFPIDTNIHIRQAGAGTITFVEDTDITINAPANGSLVSAGQGATLALKKVAANTWDLVGHTEEA